MLTPRAGDVPSGARNTVCTAGDHNYLWGLFLIAASMRRFGMDEPLLVGAKALTARDRRVLEQFGRVAFLDLGHAGRSLTCHKAEVMLAAGTEFVTWADSDALFKGNCSALLPPPDARAIRVRRRGAAEMPGAFPAGCDLARILATWRLDVAAAAGLPPAAIPEATAADVAAFRSCSACYLSLARSQERFLRVWHALQMRLPEGDVGVVDRSLACYHQLDESCLNACLAFLPGAPEVTETYGLDRDPERIYLHFIGRPKPWEGWTPRSARHIETVVSTVEWAVAQGLELPGGVPFSLRRAHLALNRRTARLCEVLFKIRRRLDGLRRRLGRAAGA